MLNKPHKVFKKSGWNLIFALASTVIMVLYAQFVLGHFSKCFLIEHEPNSLGLKFSYTFHEAISFFSIRTVDQLDCYRHFIGVWDTIFPVLYTIMYILWLNLLFRNKWIIFITPLLHMILDWAENSMELKMVGQFLNENAVNPTTVKIGSLLTSMKWITSSATYLLILIGIAYTIFRFSIQPKLTKIPKDKGS